MGGRPTSILYCAVAAVIGEVAKLALFSPITSEYSGAHLLQVQAEIGY